METYAYRITIFDSNWQYLTFKNFTMPAYMITVNNSLYISSDFNFYKTDKYLNIIRHYISSTAVYRGLYYNSSSNKIYVAAHIKCAIDVFDLNLTLVDSISTLSYSPWSIQGYKNYIYAGTYNSSNLLVIENKVIIQIYPVCNCLSSILIDNFGYMALSCLNDRKIYFYYSANVSYTGMNKTYTLKPYYINFDSNGRFIFISTNQIDIYY